MFYLGGSDFPASAESLMAAITVGLKRAMQFPAGGPAVNASGAFPTLDSLAIDLTGGQVDPDRQSPPPKGVGATTPGITVVTLSVTAKPVRVAAGQLTLDLTAKNAQLDFDRDSSGAPLLVVAHAQDGFVAVSIPHADLEALVYTKAKAMAAQQGANITQLTLKLTALGPRAIAVEMKCSVKKFFVSGVVRMFGQLDINDQLVARLSKLDVKGEGLAMSIAETFLRGKLKQAEGKEIELASFAVGGLKLRDVTIDPSGPIQVTAAFGR